MEKREETGPKPPSPEGLWPAGSLTLTVIGEIHLYACVVFHNTHSHPDLIVWLPSLFIPKWLHLWLWSPETLYQTLSRSLFLKPPRGVTGQIPRDFWVDCFRVSGIWLTERLCQRQGLCALLSSLAFLSKACPLPVTHNFPPGIPTGGLIRAATFSGRNHSGLKEQNLIKFYL